MPQYITSPFKPSPALLVSGTPTYLLGSYDDRSAPTFGYIISDSAVTTTATVTFQIVQGNGPAVGDAITVRGAGRSNNFNVTNGTILTVSTDTTTGICTVTYTISSTTLGTASDGGQVEIPRPEVGEATFNGASVPAAAPFNNPNLQQGRTVTATATFPIAPAQGTVFLQGAMFDIDAQYETLGVVAGVGSVNSGPTLSIADEAYRFYRFLMVGMIGGTVVGKISC